MITAKQKNIFEYIYYAVCLIFTAIFIFEVPKIVFFSPLLLFAAFILYGLYTRRPLSCNIAAVVLFAFTVVFECFTYNPKYSLYYHAYIHLHAVFMYVIGLNFVNDKPVEERKKIIEKFFLFIACAYIAYVGITFVNYYFNTPADLEARFYYSIWYSTVTKPATVISMSLVFALAFGTYALFYLKKTYKIIGALLVFIAIFINIVTGTRTLVFLFPVLAAAEFFGWYIFKKKKYKKGLILLGVCSGVFIAAVILYFSLRGFISQNVESLVLRRFFTPTNSTKLRFLYSLNVLKDFKLTYLGGGVHSRTFGTPHNIWLYIYDWGGIIPFALYAVFTGILIRDYVRLLKNKCLSVDFKALLSTILFLVFVEFMMEPFIDPLPSFYILCFFVLGLVSGFSKTPTEQKTHELPLKTENEKI